MAETPDRLSPLASIVIPVFNGMPFFRRALQSALQQTYPNTEIICVDDGSNDDTPEFLREAAAAHDNVVVTRQENAGVAAARNRGIALARGKFVSFLDADDLWHPEKIASEIAALERSDPTFGVAYSLYRRINLADEVIGGAPYNGSLQGDVVVPLMTHNIVGNCSAFTVRKSDLNRTPGFDPSLRARGAEGCEDWKLLCQLAQICKFVLVPRYLVGYRRHPAAMSGNVRAMRRSWRLVFDDLEKDGLAIPRHLERARRGRLEFSLLRTAVLTNAVTARELGSLVLTLQSPQSAWLTIRWLAKLAYRATGRSSARRRKRLVNFGEMRSDEGVPSSTQS
jgi:glycosyltransferase involved in cell wall biosynthesis